MITAIKTVSDNLGTEPQFVSLKEKLYIDLKLCKNKVLFNWLILRDYFWATYQTKYNCNSMIQTL